MVNENGMVCELLPATKFRGDGVVIFTPSTTERGGLLRIATPKTAEYAVAEFPASWGRGFRLVKRFFATDKTSASEDVFISTRPDVASRCTCRGFSRHGHCEHLEAMKIVAASGALPK